MGLRTRFSFVSIVIVLGFLTMTTTPNSFASHASASRPSISKSAYGKLPDGTAIDAYTLHGSAGASATVITYGATLTNLLVPDRSGKLGDVVLGFDNLQGYLGTNPFFGCTVGRYANRIANGKFTLDGKEYKLFVNNGPNSLHGGKVGFDKHVWTAEPSESANAQSVKFTYVSADGEEGYPGKLTVTVTYTLTDTNELKLNYTAVTDKPTVLNLTNHTYFNLAGHGDMLQQVLTLHADNYTPVDSTLIPTGKIAPVAGTPLDFSKPTAIGAHIAELPEIGGYDHNLVVNGKPGTLRPVALVTDPSTGRTMEVLSTEPGVQFYSAIHLDGTVAGKNGVKYAKYGAFCLETQHYPDSPNHPAFPSSVLRPGSTFTSETIYKFSAK